MPPYAFRLAAAIQAESPDLVLFGQQATDGDGAVLWAAVADKLCMPVVSQISELEVAGGQATAKRQTEFGYDTIRAPLPAVLAVFCIVAGFFLGLFVIPVLEKLLVPGEGKIAERLGFLLTVALWIGCVIAGMILGLAVALTLWAAPQRAKRTRFRAVQWNTGSVAVAFGAGSALLLLLAGGALLGASFAWDPFPRLDAPEFDPVLGAAVFGLLVPAFVTRGAPA